MVDTKNPSNGQVVIFTILYFQIHYYATYVLLYCLSVNIRYYINVKKKGMFAYMNEELRATVSGFYVFYPCVSFELR